MHKIVVLNGPNLNLLGKREPEIYGTTTLDMIVSELQQVATINNIALEHFQSNSEAELITKAATFLNDKCDFMLINPAAFTHTSIALRDTLSAIKIPFIEIHLSNIYTREEFRHKSYFSDIALGVISGLGADGYKLALEYAINFLKKG